MKRLLLLLCALPAFASISVTVDYTSHSSARFSGTISAGCYLIRIGPSSGSYTTYSGYAVGSTTVSFSAGSLVPSTHYHYVVDRYAACSDMSPAETSADATFDTSAAPVPHPAHPVTTTTWTPTHPDVSMYTQVLMECLTPNYYPVAASNVTAPMGGGWSGNVTAGDDLQDVINTVDVRTKILLPKGHNCHVNSTVPTTGLGYMLPAKTDDMSGDYIVIGCYSATPDQDFPPFGVQTDPVQWPNLCELQIQAPGTNEASHTGQVFGCSSTNCHHFWIENLKLTVVNPASNVTNPHLYDTFIQIDPETENPNHIVVDRVQMITQTPARMYNGMAFGGDTVAVINSYIDVDNWYPGLFPYGCDGSILPTIAGNVITIPYQDMGASCQVAYKFNYFDGTSAHMSANSTITTTGTGTGEFYVYMSPISPGTNGLTISYHNLSSPPVCGGAGCTVADSTFTLPSTAWFLMYVSVTGGVPTIFYDYNMFNNQTSTGRWQPTPIFTWTGDDHRYENNYIKGLGQGMYSDANGTYNLTNATVTHNYMHSPAERFSANPDWDGRNRSYRNSFEWKQGVDVKITGNIFNGSGAFQNTGAAIDIAGSYPGVGTHDWLIRDNTFLNTSAVWALVGGGAQGAGTNDAPQLSRVEITNNLSLKQDRDTHTNLINNANPLWSCWGEIGPGTEDVIITHNTALEIKGIAGCDLLSSSNGAASGYPGLTGEGLAFTDNLLGLWDRFRYNSLSYTQPILCVAGTWPYHPPSPEIDCTTGTVQDVLGTYYYRIGSGPNFSMIDNYFIGEYYGPTSFVPNPVTYTEMDATHTALVATDLSTGNTVPNQATVAARLASIGWDSSTNMASMCGGCGTDTTLLPAAQGVITNITPGSPTSTTFPISYTAPDTRACYIDVDTASDFSSMAFSRTSDSGGSVSRTPTITGLSPSTGYYYRVLCYRMQGVLEGSGDSNTGMFTTDSGTGGGPLTISGKVSFSGKTR